MSKIKNILLALLLLAPSAALAANKAPAITSAASATFTVGIVGTFTVTATGTPTPTFSETGMLPSGVTLTSAGVLSGTPAAGNYGTYPITITAANGVSPSATQAFTLTVNPLHYVSMTFGASTGSGVTSYNVYRVQCTAPMATVGGVLNASCPAGSPAPKIIGTTTTTSYLDATVVAGQSYQYYVTAVCPTCSPSESAPSNILVGTIPPAAPGTVVIGESNVPGELTIPDGGVVTVFVQ